MSDNWPPLDTHAHIDVAINARDLLSLRAVIFAASRSLDESRKAIRRRPRDMLTVWGLGVHPAVKDAYDSAAFSALLDETAYVGEVGLDGKVESRLAQQREILVSILQQLQQRPRLTSIHSRGATVEIVEELERTPITGAILHWWLGDPALTERAVDLGAYFSINASGLRRRTLIDTIPLDRLLIETDHPDGNRSARAPRQPGNVSDVEEALASKHDLRPADLRAKTWQNLATLVRTTKTGELLPPRVRAILESTA